MNVIVQRPYVAAAKALLAAAQLPNADLTPGHCDQQHAVEHARSVGVHTLYLLTNSAESFCLRRGYTTASRDAAPEAIRSTREFSCPNNFEAIERD